MEDFHHEHFWYVFCFSKPRRIKETVVAPVCPDVDKKGGDQFKFIRVFDGAKCCSYVLEHTNPIAASKAIVTCKIDNVLAISDLDVARIDPMFQAMDFDCVTDGKLVPLSFVNKLLTNEEMDRSEMRELLLRNAVALNREIGRNDIMEQLLALKLGDEFTVTRTPMTKRNGQNFSPYSRSKQDLCVQYKPNAFINDSVLAGLGIVTSSPTVVEGDLMISDEGEVITGVMEFKRNMVEDSQTLAEMLCCLTDCCLEQIKNGKQIKKAVAYGMAVNYLLKNVELFKLTLDFLTNSSKIQKLKNEMPMSDGINFFIAALKKVDAM